MSRPQRLLSLSPNVSMILFALGADDRVVGRTHYCLPSIRSYLEVWGLSADAVAPRLRHWEALPEVGGWPQADREQTMALRPDMVLASGTGTLDAYEAGMFGLGPDAFRNFDIRTLADLDRQILAIGEIVGEPETARDIVARLAAQRDAVLAGRIAPARRPTVLFEYCVCIKYDPDPKRRFANPGRFVMAGGHLAPELIRLSGGEPLFASPGDTVAWTEFKAIRDAQPDMVLAFDCNGCPNAMTHPVPARPGWSDLTAVSDGAVYRPTKNIANPNLCYPEALAELVALVTAWDQAHRPA
ncbi:MAG TPA: ABC transporter substrate-binding protein [Hypericibacter adhaerens]|jgi:iron complex transport system substrate-binding protein|uniref:ABC transporter substrate-binding protein n=1 Tax=Hypericibacter adhaerens TaxID=2602016 RepID=UPI002C850534|nr:ABC transporter substrate-binding protein [Hypericibacter adhaerens]HWA44486.1 ABC transporter substrate-binding protein [Hypericibacter adhaerens]